MLSPSHFSPLVMASMSMHMLNVVRLVAPVSNLVATAWFDFLQNGTISEKDPSNRLYIASTRFWISACVAPSDHSRHYSRPSLEITSVCLSLTFPSCCIYFLSDLHILQWYTMFVSSTLCRWLVSCLGLSSMFHEGATMDLYRLLDNLWIVRAYDFLLWRGAQEHTTLKPTVCFLCNVVWFSCLHAYRVVCWRVSAFRNRSRPVIWPACQRVEAGFSATFCLLSSHSMHLNLFYILWLFWIFVHSDSAAGRKLLRGSAYYLPSWLSIVWPLM